MRRGGAANSLEGRSTTATGAKIKGRPLALAGALAAASGCEKRFRNGAAAARRKAPRIQDTRGLEGSIIMGLLTRKGSRRQATASTKGALRLSATRP